MGVTLATHIRDKQSKITHPCLRLCPQPLLSDNAQLELWFPSGCTDRSTLHFWTAVMIPRSPAVCLSRSAQHWNWISPLQQMLREVGLLHSQSTNMSSHQPQQLLKSDSLGWILFPLLPYKLPVLDRVTTSSQPWLSLNIGRIFMSEPQRRTEVHGRTVQQI